MGYFLLLLTKSVAYFKMFYLKLINVLPFIEVNLSKYKVFVISFQNGIKIKATIKEMV